MGEFEWSLMCSFPSRKLQMRPVHFPMKLMYSNYLEQLQVADELGYGVAWLAQAHLSTEVQKQNRNPVIPHWQGEVGLCTDFFQLALLSMEKTNRIEIGSAVLSILANGGPIAVAERIGNFCALQEVRGDSRKLNVGFSAGRFQFMAAPYGIVPRNELEEAAWSALRGKIFWEASEIMLRLIRGDTICSDDIRETILTREDFRSDEDWKAYKMQTVVVIQKSKSLAAMSLKTSNRSPKNGIERS